MKEDETGLAKAKRCFDCRCEKSKVRGNLTQSIGKTVGILRESKIAWRLIEHMRGILFHLQKLGLLNILL